MLAREEQLQAAATVKVELGLSATDMHPITNTKPSSNNRKRFTDEQTKSLEFMFGSDSRPESLTKRQLANELGLQPRQIDTSSYESLEKENQSLRDQQLQKLKSQVEIEHGNKTYGPNRTAGNSAGGKVENRSAMFDAKESITFPFEVFNHLISSDNNVGNVESNDDGRMVLDMMEATDGSLTSSEKWSSFESNCFLDESSCSSNWWEYL